MPNSSGPTKAGPLPKARRSTHARPTNGAVFLTEAAVVAAVGKYIKAHPKTYCVTVGVRGKKVVVEPAEQPAAIKKKRTLRLPPPGYFARFYTAEDAAEDNRLAAASILFDPADFRQ